MSTPVKGLLIAAALLGVGYWLGTKKGCGCQ